MTTKTKQKQKHNTQSHPNRHMKIYFWKWLICPLPLLWRCVHMYLHISELIKLYILIMCCFKIFFVYQLYLKNKATYFFFSFYQSCQTYWQILFLLLPYFSLNEYKMGRDVVGFYSWFWLYQVFKFLLINLARR